MSLLAMDGIEKEFQNQKVLNGASLRVERGERVVLIGDNGSGKSTLLKIAMGLEKADAGTVTLSRRTVAGYLSQELMELRDQDEAQTAGRLAEVERLEKEMRRMEKCMAEAGEEQLIDLMKEYERLQGAYEEIDGYRVESRLKAILSGLGLGHHAFDIPIEKLSGGEKMRVALARLLIREPDLLLLDEPTNHLDLWATEWLEGFLRSFPGGVVFVSHDRYFINRVATRIVELAGGTTTESRGTLDEYFRQKEIQEAFLEKEKQRLRWHIRAEEAKAQTFRSQRKHGKMHQREARAAQLREELNRVNSLSRDSHLSHQAKMRLDTGYEIHLSDEIAWAEGLGKRFGDKWLFRDVSFLIQGGDKVGIIGPNGCGKTTMLRLLMGQDTDYEGTLKLGAWVKYAYLGQETVFPDEGLTIAQHLMNEGGFTRKEALAQAGKYGFYGDICDKPIAVLSGGEKVRLNLCCLLMGKPTCLILDEPTNHLDMVSRDVLMYAVDEYGGTVIAVTHDRYFLNRCVDRLFAFEDGSVKVWEGNYADYKKGTAKDTEEAPPPKPKPKKAPAKQDAARQEKNQEQQAKELMEQIEGLEAKLAAMQADFGPDTPWQAYQEYKVLEQERDELYEQWEALQ
jgi:ATP-binding cassette subfamily F protein 3